MVHMYWRTTNTTSNRDIARTLRMSRRGAGMNGELETGDDN